MRLDRKAPLPRKVPTTPSRSKIMSAIKGKGNQSTEMRLCQLMRENGVKGWRRHLDLPGRPDFCFPLVFVAVFVDGCFWHGCPRCFKLPKKNTEFWREKIRRNRARDRKNVRLLESNGWRVIRFWEHSLRLFPGRAVRRLQRILAFSSPRSD